MPWMARLTQAQSEVDVLEICREYLAQLSPSEIALLPKECRPSHIEGTDDLRAYADVLVHHHAHGDGARLVLRVADFFSRASERLNQLSNGGR